MGKEVEIHLPAGEKIMLYTPSYYTKQGYSEVEAQNKLNDKRNEKIKDESVKRITRAIRNGIVQRLYVG
ncbi:MAG: hypothetical protein ACRDCY_22665 [Aeromonas veronii]